MVARCASSTITHLNISEGHLFRLRSLAKTWGVRKNTLYFFHAKYLCSGAILPTKLKILKCILNGYNTKSGLCAMLIRKHYKIEYILKQTKAKHASCIRVAGCSSACSRRVRGVSMHAWLQFAQVWTRL